MPAAALGLGMRGRFHSLVAFGQRMQHDHRVFGVGIGHHRPVGRDRALLELGQLGQAAHRADRDVGFERLGLEHQFDDRRDRAEGQRDMREIGIATPQRDALARAVEKGQLDHAVGHHRARAEAVRPRRQRADDRLFHVIARIEQPAAVPVAQEQLELAYRDRGAHAHRLARGVVGERLQPALAHQHRGDTGHHLHAIVGMRLPHAAVASLAHQPLQRRLVLRNACLGLATEDVDPRTDPAFSLGPDGACVGRALAAAQIAPDHGVSPCQAPVDPT